MEMTDSLWGFPQWLPEIRVSLRGNDITETFPPSVKRSYSDLQRYFPMKSVTSAYDDREKLR